MDAKRFALHIHRRRAVVKQLNSERQKKNRFRPKPGPSATRILDIGFCPERSHGLVTLSPECFSTFPHGTCSLSVLWIYLALGGVYLLLSAACSSNATLREERSSLRTHSRGHTGLAPSMVPCIELSPRKMSTQLA